MVYENESEAGLAVTGEPAAPEETSRMRSAPLSAMYTFPAASTATALMLTNQALVGGPPSPFPCPMLWPPPASVLMIPAVLTLRIFAPPVSAMYRLPAASTATHVGVMPALVAGPPSPRASGLPLPATVVMIPLVSTLRMCVALSAKYRFPARSTVRPCGSASFALVAGPPSPE